MAEGGPAEQAPVVQEADGDVGELLEAVGSADDVNQNSQDANVKEAEDTEAAPDVKPKHTYRELIREGVQQIRPAMEKDRKQEFPDALRLYAKGLERLIHAYKDPDLPENLRRVLLKKISGFMTRAEHLKNHVIHGETSDQCAFCCSKNSEDCPLICQFDPERRKLREYVTGFIMELNTKVNWDDVKGHAEKKDTIKECLILPLRFPHLFSGMRSPQRIMFVYGHPGTGKTILINAAANEIPDVTLFKLSVWDLRARQIHDGERLVKELFEMAAEKKPSIICIEDIEVIDNPEDQGGAEHCWRRLKTELLIAMQHMWQQKGQFKEVSLVIMSQRPWMCSAAMRRRFEKRVRLSLPLSADRVEIIKSSMSQASHCLTEEDFSKLGNRTFASPEYTQADLVCLCRDAMMNTVRRIQKAEYFKKVSDADQERWTPCDKDDEGAVKMKWDKLNPDELLEPEINMNDFLDSLERMRGTISPEEETLLNNWSRDFDEY